VWLIVTWNQNILRSHFSYVYLTQAARVSNAHFNYFTHTYHQCTFTRLLNTYKICMALGAQSFWHDSLHKARTNNFCIWGIENRVAIMKFKKNIRNVKFCTKIKQAFRNYSSTKMNTSPELAFWVNIRHWWTHWYAIHFSVPLFSLHSLLTKLPTGKTWK
jgi:hypothetical protein